ncbi:FIG01092715: hypothetical protein [Olavius algarvensis associated proteobacterium Delta 3]|nr:FIG01092715: hypothetical protein [Olavius algarvensis associated proteobacterium Delta 3]CAB5107566.1 FIG01092715: hypothetical protein [Olavius algarvensis associated proteobacterium Delta 3]
MKKIGILFGQENTYPQAFVERVNAKRPKGITAEFVRIDKVLQARGGEYAVIVDRISQDVPFYRAYLKNAAFGGTAVINNPFWWSADDKFFNNALAETIGVAVPRSVLLPSNQHPPDTDSNSMRNMAYPLDWEAIFDYVGFPAYLKPFAGGGWKNVFRVADPEDFYRVYNQTGDLVMMLQEEIVFSDYFRCYCVDRRDVHIMPYEPRNPSHLRYVATPSPESADLMEAMEAAVLKLNLALGYDFNTVELAIRDGVPYAIDFCNPAPDADYHSVQADNFEWVVEATANMTIRRAKAHREGVNNLTWGEFVTSFAKEAFPI